MSEHEAEDSFNLNPLGELCECVVTHTPAAFVPNHHHIVPQSWGGQTVDENMVWLCPSSHTAVHRLLNEYVRADGDPGWEVRRQYGPYVRSIALKAWNQRPADPGYTVAHPDH